MLTLLCRFDDLEDGESRGFDPRRGGQDTLFVVRRGDAVYGWQNACPHIEGAPLPWRRHAYLNADRDLIVCSAHGALFEIDSGLCILGPCIGASLRRVALTVDTDRRIFADIPES